MQTTVDLFAASGLAPSLKVQMPRGRLRFPAVIKLKAARAAFECFGTAQEHLRRPNGADSTVLLPVCVGAALQEAN